MIVWKIDPYEELIAVSMRIFEFSKHIHCLSQERRYEELNLIPFLTSEPFDMSQIGDDVDMEELDELSQDFTIRWHDESLREAFKYEDPTLRCSKMSDSMQVSSRMNSLCDMMSSLFERVKLDKMSQAMEAIE